MIYISNFCPQTGEKKLTLVQSGVTAWGIGCGMVSVALFLSSFAPILYLFLIIGCGMVFCFVSFACVLLNLIHFLLLWHRLWDGTLLCFFTHRCFICSYFTSYHWVTAWGIGCGMVSVALFAHVLQMLYPLLIIGCGMVGCFVSFKVLYVSFAHILQLLYIGCGMVCCSKIYLPVFCPISYNSL